MQSEAAPLLGELVVMLRLSVHACCLSWQASPVCMTCSPFSHAAEQLCMPCRACSQSQWGGGCSTATSLNGTDDVIYPKVSGLQQVYHQLA